MIIDVFKNLRAGLTVCFAPRASANFRPRVLQICIGLALNLLIIAAFDYARQSGEIYFSDIGAAQWGAVLFIAVFTAFALCSRAADLSRLPLLLTVLTYVAPWYLLVFYTLKDFSGSLADTDPARFAILLLGLVLLFRSVNIAFPVPRLGAYLAVVAVTFGSLALAQERYFQPELFYGYSPDEDDVYARVDREKTYYLQRQLLQNKLDRLRPQIPGRADVYFVGFAGNGDEGVFMSEANFARDVMEDRYMTEGRSLVLASDIHRLDEEPLANAYNLESALKSVGGLMDPEEDVLFLFLTSHGSADGKLTRN